MQFACAIWCREADRLPLHVAVGFPHLAGDLDAATARDRSTARLHTTRSDQGSRQASDVSPAFRLPWDVVVASHTLAVLDCGLFKEAVRLPLPHLTASSRHRLEEGLSASITRASSLPARRGVRAGCRRLPQGSRPSIPCGRGATSLLKSLRRPLYAAAYANDLDPIVDVSFKPPHRTVKPSALTPLCTRGVARSRDSERLRGHAGRCPSNGRSHGCKPRERGTSRPIRVGVEMTLQIHGQVVPSGHSEMNKTPEDWRPWRVPLGADPAWDCAVTIEV